MNNYNNNNEHESIELSIYRDYDMSYEDFKIINNLTEYIRDYHFDGNDIFIDADLKIKDIYNVNKLKKMKKEELADIMNNIFEYSWDDATKKEMIDVLLNDEIEHYKDTSTVKKAKIIEKILKKNIKIYEVYGFSQGDYCFFITDKDFTDTQLQNNFYNAPLFMRLEIDDAEYFESDIIDGICYDIDELKDAAIKFLKKKNYSQYVIDWIDSNFKVNY